MRLFTQIYLAFVGVALLCVAAVAGVAVLLSDGMSGFQNDAQDLAEVFAASLPEDPEQRQRRLEQLGRRLDGAVALWAPDGALIAATGPVPHGPPGHFRGRAGHGLRVALSDGRLVGYRSVPPPLRHSRFVAVLVALAAAVALGSWPLARRLSSRLERLRGGVAAWGDGDLDARVRLAGSDEVAEVGRAFDAAADRVQSLVDAQRRVLASASHELRSPLARLRVTLELLDDAGDQPLVQAAIRDVEALDDTVGEVLEAARLEALGRLREVEPIDLLPLLEAHARAGDVVDAPEGARRHIVGDRRLLGRLARNLVDNAHRHGAPPVRLVLTDAGFDVCDAGPRPAEGDRVFEPFFRASGHAEGVDGGVGLGLALVRQIARAHGGDVALAPGDTTCFRVTLPAPRLGE